MEWFYEQNGQPAGPVTRGELLRLIVQRRIQPQTLVWTPSFGDQWRPAARAGLIAPLRSLSAASSARLQERERAAAKSDLLSATQVPEAVRAASVPALWGWIFIFGKEILPLYVAFNTYLHGVPDPATCSIILLLVLTIQLTAFITDRRYLERAGFRPPSFWWFLCAPGYFWVRRRILGGRGSDLLIGCSLFFLLRLLVAVASEQKFSKLLEETLVAGKFHHSAPGSSLFSAPDSDGTVGGNSGNREKISPSPAPAEPSTSDEPESGDSDTLQL
ncbi:DUF4339 domain-containing protein [Oecophyllibacter saccharovorans]|uniref:DUF4339 domain-containing protein n=1 Tax=Oecophyllibacter saccharovorans TaxID=2558360 RepID=UPI001143E6C3|nr:DUF4339 domain-containing protein [Oecophyllibacter saccharovorans]QDH14779.1 DUF4339 domain-containing protein [Oecophyllibacter saccharovorans]